MLIKINLNTYNVFEKKNLLERFKHEFCKKGKLIDKLSDAIQLYHILDIKNGFESYYFDIIPTNQIKRYKYSLDKFCVSMKDATLLFTYFHPFTYYSIQITFLYDKNILQITSKKITSHNFMFWNQGQYYCKALDKKDLIFIKQINKMFFDCKDDIIQSLIDEIKI